MIKPFYAYGHYQVGHQDYVKKTDALVAATKQKLPVHWNFHDEVYSTADWTRRPAGTLKELYRIRAQQLRDRYDYIVIHFSGGADSWTVLNSFLSNGIHVDEVYTRWARAERKYTAATDQDRRECNLSSEYEYATEPVLKEIQKKYPRTHIHLDDYSDAYTKEVNEKTLETSSHYITMGTFHRFTRKSPGELAAVAQGRKVGVVYGFDKVQCSLQQGNFSAYFVDRFGSTDIDPDRTQEGFYWTPDLVEIPIMQAHDLRLYYQTIVDRVRSKHLDPRECFIRTCYADYNLNTFQVEKPLGSKVWASEQWIKKYNSRYVESWEWALGQYTHNIDDAFYEVFGNRIKLGYKTMRSRSYHVGTIVGAEQLNFEFTH